MSSWPRDVCVLCEANTASHRGEHVWPQWYLRNPPGGAGPYAWSRNGRPLVRRDGVTPIVEQHLTRVTLPVCRPCNATLNARFEVPAKSLIRRLFGGQHLPHWDARQGVVASLWLVKTWLLLAHPMVRFAHSRIDAAHAGMRWPEPAEPMFYRWLVTGDEPPAGLSMWLHRTAVDDSSASVGPRLVLPTSHEEGRTSRAQAHEVTLHGLTVALVVHPGWPIDHPLEASGRAVRLWPAGGVAFDLDALPVLAGSDRVLWSHGLAVQLESGALASGQLPPLRAGGLPAVDLMGCDLVRGVSARGGR